MLKNTGQESFRFVDDDFAVTIEGPDFNALVTVDITVIAGNTQAAFRTELHLFRCFQEFRIDQLDQTVAVVEDDNLLGFADLRCCQTDAFGFIVCAMSSRSRFIFFVIVFTGAAVSFKIGAPALTIFNIAIFIHLSQSSSFFVYQCI